MNICLDYLCSGSYLFNKQRVQVELAFDEGRTSNINILELDLLMLCYPFWMYLAALKNLCPEPVDEAVTTVKSIRFDPFDIFPYILMRCMFDTKGTYLNQLALKL